VSGFAKPRLARVHDVLARHTERGEIPGAVALIARGGETHVTVAGECRRDTIFRISSMTKPVTAVAAMICVEECALRLDDPVDALLPELAARRVRETTLFDAPNGQWSSPPAFPSGGGGLVATIDDYAAFAAMLLADGAYGGQRILSRPAVSLMTADHLTPAQKAVSGLLPGDFDDTGWGFGVSVVTRRTGLAKSVGSYGWDGGLGTSWFNDPAEGLTAILMTQRMWTLPRPGAIFRDFWTSAYQAIDD
jgi:CubicO group peptidase (beta-lactamase class C family)